MGFAEMGICVDNVEILKPALKFTLAMLADRADPFTDETKTIARTDGRVECWPAISDLMRRTNQSRSTILRHLRDLEALEIIEVEHRWRRASNGQYRQTTSRYILNLPDMLAGRFRKAAEADKSKGVKMTPLKSEVDKTPGHGKGVKMTPLLSRVSKPRKSKSVNSDTPIKDQDLTTIPSLHPSHESNEGQAGAAAPRGAAPDGSAGTGETDSSSFESAAEAAPPAVMTDSDEGASEHDAVSGSVSDVDSKDVVTPMESGKTAQMAAETPLRPRGASGEERQLLTEVLPQEMQAIPPRDQSRVARAVADRVEAGWPKKAIHAALAARALPGQVKNLTALVMWRLREDVPVDGAPLSASVRQHTVQLVTSSGQAVSRRDIDAGALAMAYRQAVSAGDCSEDTSRWEFAQAVGVERFLL